MIKMIIEKSKKTFFGGLKFTFLQLNDSVFRTKKKVKVGKNKSCYYIYFHKDQIDYFHFTPKQPKKIDKNKFEIRSLQSDLTDITQLEVKKTTKDELIRELQVNYKKVAIFYEFSDSAKSKVKDFYGTFEELTISHKAWFITNQYNVESRKFHGGASSKEERKEITIQFSKLPKIESNLKFPEIPFGREKLFLLPDIMITFYLNICKPISYHNIVAAQKNQEFIEFGKVPKDAEVVDWTWKFVNKSGEPDLRFKENEEIPVLSYSEIYLQDTNNFHIQISFSRRNIGKKFAHLLTSYSRNAFINGNYNFINNKII